MSSARVGITDSSITTASLFLELVIVFSRSLRVEVEVTLSREAASSEKD